MSKATNYILKSYRLAKEIKAKGEVHKVNAYALTKDDLLIDLVLNADAQKVVDKGKKIYTTLMAETTTNNTALLAKAEVEDLERRLEIAKKAMEKANKQAESKPNGKAGKAKNKPANENKPLENAAE